ncbi:hypothetical protein EZS27_022474 [termite gut metagenome]|uniref:Uncharacterized protein n=1 Tax=termite gut metagenome TaxID=433724 RepID=A0A5J4R4S6_9ZZZZ
MEKKFMKYILFGVFTFVLGIAFVGCGEDYDDDINSLKTEDAALQKAIDDLKIQVAALEKAGGGTGTNYGDIIAAIQVQINDLQGAISEPDAIGAKLVANQAFVNAIIAKISASNPDLVTLGSLITSVSIVDAADWSYNVVPAKATYTFPNLTNYVGTPINFIKDQVRADAAKVDVILKVTPANAKLEGKTIYLVNSLGGTDINKYITASAVPYDVLQTKADATGSGLYKVSFTLNSTYSPETKAEFELLTNYDKNGNGKIDSGEKPIKFAIAVDSERPVLSEFGTTVKVGAPESVYTTASVINPGDEKLINFNVTTTVDGKKQDVATNVTEIHNAFAGNDNGTESVWKNSSDKSKPDTDIEQAKRNDERLLQPLIVTDLGTDIIVSILGPTNVLAYYVGLDLQNANDADKKLWQEEVAAGNITGVNQAKLLDGSKDADKATLVIKGTNLQDKEIGFRVYVINHDGTLVDPDGRAFYVSTGVIAPPDAPVPTVGKITFTTEILTHVGDVEKVGTIKVPITDLKLGINNIPAADIKNAVLTFDDKAFNDKYGNVVFYKNDAASLPNDLVAIGTDGSFADVAGDGGGDAVTHIAIGERTVTSALNDKTLLLSDIDDTTEHTGTLELIGDGGKAFAKYDVSLKKVLPTGFPGQQKNISTEELAPTIWGIKTTPKVEVLGYGARFFVPVVNKINFKGGFKAGAVSDFESASYSITDILTSSTNYAHVLFSLTASKVATEGVVSSDASDVTVTIKDIASVKENVEYVGKLQYDWGKIKKGGASHIVSYENPALREFTVLLAPNLLYNYRFKPASGIPADLAIAAVSLSAGALVTAPWPAISYNATNEQVTVAFDIEIQRRLNKTIFTDVDDAAYASFSRNEFEKYYNLQGLKATLTAAENAAINPAINPILTVGYRNADGTATNGANLPNIGDGTATAWTGIASAVPTTNKQINLNASPLFNKDTCVGSFSLTIKQTDTNYQGIAKFIKAANDHAVTTGNTAYATRLLFAPYFELNSVIPGVGVDDLGPFDTLPIPSIPIDVTIVK